MLKFIKGSMESIIDVEVFPIIALLLFLTVFIGWTVYAIRSKKDYIRKMSELPLDDK
jgi:hypothetical protein